jgi:hypothetical protein
MKSDDLIIAIFIISALVHCIGIFVASLSAHDLTILFKSFIPFIYLLLQKYVSTYFVSSHHFIISSKNSLTFGYDWKKVSIYSLDSFIEVQIIFDNPKPLIQ